MISPHSHKYRKYLDDKGGTVSACVLCGKERPTMDLNDVIKLYRRKRRRNKSGL